MIRDAMSLQNQQGYDQRTAYETAIRNHYGFKDLGEFQNSWVKWVNSGMPVK